MSTDRSMTIGALLVSAELGNGHKNARPGKALQEALHVDGRTLRQYIEDARAAGVVICNEQDGKGYFIAATMDEAERQYWQEHNRALSILRRMTPLRRMLVKAGRKVTTAKGQ